MELSQWLQEQAIQPNLVRIHKPYGIPSTAITEMYKKVTGEKVGHGGTLDPFAEGALILGIGKGTKLLTQHLGGDKTYRATFLFGATTPSGDLELSLKVDVLFDSDSFSERITQELEFMKQGFTQKIPVHSAAKQKGKSSYDLIRAGKEGVERYKETKLLEYSVAMATVISKQEVLHMISKKMEQLRQNFAEFVVFGEKITYPAQKYNFLLEKWLSTMEESLKNVEVSDLQEFGLLEITVIVPKGTYIRSVGEELGLRLQSGVVMVGLVRK